LNASAADATIGQRVLREHVASVWATRYTSIPAHLCFATALGLFIYFKHDHPWALPWLAVLVAVDVYVLLTPGWHRGLPISESPWWARKYARLVTLVSAATAPGPWFFISAENLVLTTVMVVVVMVSWTRAVQALWALKPALLGYGIPMMTGLIVALAAQGDSLHLFLAAFGAAHLLLTLRTGLRQNKVLTEALTLRFENEALAARLREQIAATERASAEKTRFLATASHDLRQPLHAIALFGAALENTLRDRPEGKNAERLMRAVNAVGTSLDTMLDVSRLDAGVVTPELTAVQLDALFLRLNHMFSAQAEQKSLQLRLRASGLRVRSDPQLLSRMLANLIDNALKYTAHGGLTVTARARGETVWIDVCDTGIGIPSERLGQIFEEFYQIDNPGRDRARGLGIGLSIVQRLSRLLGHPVQVRSRLRRGTRFRLVLPVVKASNGASVGPMPQAIEVRERDRVAAPTLPRRVLLIDDETEIRAAMTELLRSCSVDVLAVADEARAAEALTQAWVQAEPFSLLLCDYRLADGADGLAAGLRLRERFDPGMPFLLITGETAPERLQRVRESGVSVLFKPVDAAALLRAMAELAPAAP
jgi:signal transduction histidine kinase